MILLISGGLDSIAGWHLLGRPKAIHFHIGNRAQDREERALMWADPSSDVEHSAQLDLALWEKDNGYIPYRNSLLITLASLRDPVVAIGSVAEWAPDKNTRFRRRLESLLNQMGNGTYQDIHLRHRVIAPFRNITKGELLQMYRAEYGLQALHDLCVNTWSCYENLDAHCGKCSGCQQRYWAEKYASGTQLTSMRVEPKRVPANLNLVDAGRWVRDNRGVTGLYKRLRERVLAGSQ